MKKNYILYGYDNIDQSILYVKSIRRGKIEFAQSAFEARSFFLLGAVYIGLLHGLYWVHIRKRPLL